MNDEDVAENVVSDPACAMCKALRGHLDGWTRMYVNLRQHDQKVSARRDTWRAKYEEMVRQRNVQRDLACAAEMLRDLDGDRQLVLQRLSALHEQQMLVAEQAIAREQRRGDRWRSALIAATVAGVVIIAAGWPW